MKLLVTVKRVEDPEIKIKIKADGSGIETDQMKYVVNPFDEIAVEEALRLRDKEGGEVVVLSIGGSDVKHLRTTLAMGADRGILVRTDDMLDPTVTSKAMAKVIETEKPDLVILGKQAVDDDQGQVGIMLAERLGWAQGTFVSKEVSLESDEEKNKVTALKVEDGRVEVLREIDGGLETLSLEMPAILTTELRLNVPRYASLPGIMKAKKKKVEEFNLSDLVDSTENLVKIIKVEAPTERASGEMVPDVDTLFNKLHNDAKVI